MNHVVMSCGAHPTKPGFLLVELNGQKIDVYGDTLGKFGRFLSGCVKHLDFWEANARGTTLKKAKPPARRKTRSPKSAGGIEGAQT